MKDGNKYTETTRKWLNTRFSVTDEHGVYVPNQPSYGFSALAFRLEQYARSAAILNVLSRLSFRSLLDVGCADGYFPDLLRDCFSVEVTGTDLSDTALARARQLHHVAGCAADAHALPFPDDCFDVVLCSEVIEHVVAPEKLIAELKRVARKFVIITTPRARNEAEVAHHFETLDPAEPHAHIHFFTDEAFRQLCGPEMVHFSARWRAGRGILDRLAWGDASTYAQRKAYLTFTFQTANLSEDSRRAIRHELVDRYPETPGIRKALVTPITIRMLLFFDVLITTRFPGQGLDHLGVIPVSREPVNPQSPARLWRLLHRLLTFSRPQLRLNPP